MVVYKKWEVYDKDGSIIAYGFEYAPISYRKLLIQLRLLYDIPINQCSKRIKIEKV